MFGERLSRCGFFFCVPLLLCGTGGKKSMAEVPGASRSKKRTTDCRTPDQKGIPGATSAGSMFHPLGGMKIPSRVPKAGCGAIEQAPDRTTCTCCGVAQ